MILLSIAVMLAVFFLNLYVHTQLEALLQDVKTRDDIFQLNPFDISELEFVRHTTGGYYPTDHYILQPFKHLGISERFNGKCRLAEQAFKDCPDLLRITASVQVYSRYLKNGWEFFTDEGGNIIRKRYVEFYP